MTPEEERLIRKRTEEGTPTLAVADRRHLLAELDRVRVALEIRTRDYGITSERLGRARKAMQRYKEQRDDARARVPSLLAEIDRMRSEDVEPMTPDDKALLDRILSRREAS